MKVWLIVGLLFCLFVQSVLFAQSVESGPDQLWKVANSAIETAEKSGNPEASVATLRHALQSLETLLDKYPSSDQSAMLIAGSPLPQMLKEALKDAENRLQEWQNIVDNDVDSLIGSFSGWLKDIEKHEGTAFWKGVSKNYIELLGYVDRAGVRDDTIKNIIGFEDQIRDRVFGVLESAAANEKWKYLSEWAEIAKKLNREERLWGSMDVIESYISISNYNLNRNLTIEEAENSNWPAVERSASAALSYKGDDTLIRDLQARAKFERLWKEALEYHNEKEFENAWVAARDALKLRENNKEFGFNEYVIKVHDKIYKSLVFKAAISSSKSALASGAGSPKIERAFNLLELAKSKGANGKLFNDTYIGLVDHAAKLSEYMGSYTKSVNRYKVQAKYLDSIKPKYVKILGITKDNKVSIYYQYPSRYENWKRKLPSIIITLDLNTGTITSRKLQGRLQGFTRDGSYLLMTRTYRGSYPLVISHSRDDIDLSVGSTGLSIHDSTPLGDDSILYVAESGGNRRLEAFRVHESEAKDIYSKSGREDYCCGVSVSGSGKKMALARVNYNEHQGGIDLFKLPNLHNINKRTPYMSVPKSVYKQLGRISSISLSHDGSILAIHGGEHYGSRSIKHYGLISLDSPHPQLMYHKTGPSVTTVDRSFRRLLQVVKDRIELRDIHANKQLGGASLLDTQTEVLQMALSEDGKRLIVLYRDNSVEVLENKLPAIEYLADAGVRNVDNNIMSPNSRDNHAWGNDTGDLVVPKDVTKERGRKNRQAL